MIRACFCICESLADLFYRSPSLCKSACGGVRCAGFDWHIIHSHHRLPIHHSLFVTLACRLAIDCHLHHRLFSSFTLVAIIFFSHTYSFILCYTHSFLPLFLRMCRILFFAGSSSSPSSSSGGVQFDLPDVIRYWYTFCLLSLSASP